MPSFVFFLQLWFVCDHGARFEVEDQTGEALTDAQMQTRHLQKVHLLQRLAFK